MSDVEGKIVFEARHEGDLVRLVTFGTDGGGRNLVVDLRMPPHDARELAEQLRRSADEAEREVGDGGD